MKVKKENHQLFTVTNFIDFYIDENMKNIIILPSFINKKKILKMKTKIILLLVILAAILTITSC